MRKWVRGPGRWCGSAGLLMGVALLAAPLADAGLVTFQMEISGVTGAGTLIDQGTVDGVGAGSVVHLNMYVILHGATANDGVVQVVGNLHDYAGDFVGSFSAQNASPFSGSGGTQPGTQVAAPNGSKEIGSEAHWEQGASDSVTGNTYFVDASPGAASFIPVTGTPDAKGNLKVLVGTADYTVVSPSVSTDLFFFPHLRTDGDVSQQQNQRFVIGGVQYQLDGSGSNASMGVSNAFEVLPVIVMTPEPSALSFMAFCGVGLLLRRRGRRGA